MRTTLFILGGLALLLVAYWSVRFYLTVHTSKRLIENAVPYARTADSPSRTMLVLGDSTAVGIGADTPEESVAGRIAGELSIDSVESRAVSGAVVRDVKAQAAEASRERYDLILIQAGGNDIIRFTSADTAGEALRESLRSLPAAGRVILISAGDVGGATLFPWPVRPFHSRLNRAYHDTFARVAAEEGITYVNFKDSPATKEIRNNPDTYLAADGLHPSSAGYRLWFEEIRPYLPRI